MIRRPDPTDSPAGFPSLPELGQQIGRLAGLLAGMERAGWPDIVAAAADEIEDLRSCLDREHDTGRRRVGIPQPVAQWVRSVIGDDR